jgi:DNA-damage-inducible protein J
MGQVNIRIDDDLKEQAEHLFAELGMNVSTAFNVFVRQSVREGGLPFAVTTLSDPVYNPANLRRLDHSIRQMADGRSRTVTLEDLDHMADG